MKHKPWVNIKAEKYHDNLDDALIFKKSDNNVQCKTKTKSSKKNETKMCGLCGNHPEGITNPYTGKYPEWVDENSKILFECLFLPELNNTNFENNIDLGIKINKKFPEVNNLIQRFDDFNLRYEMDDKNFTFIENVYQTKEEEIEELNLKRAERIKKINGDKKFSNEQKYVKINKANENTDKKIKYAGKTISTKRYGIIFNDEQKKIVLNWMKICDHFYNFCVDLYNSGDEIFNNNNKGIKKGIFDYYFKHELTEFNQTVIENNISVAPLNKKPKETEEIIDQLNNFLITINSDDVQDSIKIKNNNVDINEIKKEKVSKPIPYDMITDELLSFCRNLDSNYTKLENKQQTHFTMHRRDYKRNYRSILLPKRAIGKNGIFERILGRMDKKIYNKDILKLVNEDKIQHDCRLAYDRLLDQFTVLIPTYTDKKRVENREKFVALDPGETIFQAFFGHKSCGIICENIRSVILKYREKMSKIQSILDKNRNRKGKKIKYKKKLRKRKRKLEKKIRDIISDIHNKTALFLCKNYDKVLIPSFHTQDMVTNKQLGRKINYSMLKLSHYKFKQHIKHKGEQYGCKVYEVTEEYTSQCCGRCGKVSKNYDERTKICCLCNTKINRDMNGSRNIFIRNYDRVLDVTKKKVNKVEHLSNKIGKK